MATENIYLLSLKDSSDQEYLKIGITSGSPADRIKGLQTGCPFPIVLKKYYTLPSIHYGHNAGVSKGSSGSKIEKILHESLDAYHSSGEWFKMSEEAWEILHYSLSSIEKYETKIQIGDAREKIESIMKQAVKNV